MTITKTASNRWTNELGGYVWQDDFGAYQVKASNGNFECSNNLETALKILEKLENA